MLRSGSPSRAPSLAPSGTDEYSAYGSPTRELIFVTPSLHFLLHVTPGTPHNIPDPPEENRGEDGGERNTDRQVASRSKWQAMLLEAGGIGAAVSEESMKRLQYCLHWLQVRVPST